MEFGRPSNSDVGQVISRNKTRSPFKMLMFLVTILLTAIVLLVVVYGTLFENKQSVDGPSVGESVNDAPISPKLLESAEPALSPPQIPENTNSPDTKEVVEPETVESESVEQVEEHSGEIDATPPEQKQPDILDQFLDQNQNAN